MLALLVGAWRSWRRTAEQLEPARAAEPLPPGPDDLLRLPWRRALVLAVAIGVIGGALFSLRMGAVVLPLSLIMMMRAGLGVWRLSMLGAAGIAALALAYLLFPAEDRGGCNFDYALHFTRAHYLAVLAVCCFAAAAALALRDLRALRASKPG